MPPHVEADTEETTAVSALPSGMAEVLRQTSGLSPRADAPVASAPTGSMAAESAQNEPTVVRPSVFANNEPTVVSPWSLATDDPSLLSKAPFGGGRLAGSARDEAAPGPVSGSRGRGPVPRRRGRSPGIARRCPTGRGHRWHIALCSAPRAGQQRADRSPRACAGAADGARPRRHDRLRTGAPHLGDRGDGVQSHGSGRRGGGLRETDGPRTRARVRPAESSRTDKYRPSGAPTAAADVSPHRRFVPLVRPLD